MAKNNVPFGFVELPKERSQDKPRRTGLTMMADFGLPLQYAKDTVELAGRDAKAGILGNFGVGYNHIDVEAARAAGIVVSNTRSSQTVLTEEPSVLKTPNVSQRPVSSDRLKFGLNSDPPGLAMFSGELS